MWFAHDQFEIMKRSGQLEIIKSNRKKDNALLFDKGRS